MEKRSWGELRKRLFCDHERWGWVAGTKEGEVRWGLGNQGMGKRQLIIVPGKQGEAEHAWAETPSPQCMLCCPIGLHL